MPAETPGTGTLIEMFTGPGCAYCAQSRELLDSRGLTYIEYDVSQPEQLAEYGRRLPRERSLPQLFIAGEHIGSYEDLQEILDSVGNDRST